MSLLMDEETEALGVSHLPEVPDSEVGRAGGGAPAPITPMLSTACPLGLAPSTGESYCSSLSLRCILLLFPEPLFVVIPLP